MATERDGLKENRESFERAKEKHSFEKEIDVNRVHVEEEKERKEAKRFDREVARREKEEAKKGE